MSVKIYPEDYPPEALQAAKRKIEALLSWEGLVSRNPEAATFLTLPHRVYFLRSRGLAGVGPLRASVDFGGWRFLVSQEAQAIAAVTTWQGDGEWRVSSVRPGTWASATRAALTGEGLDGGPYTLAYLWCRRKFVAALWLQTESGQGEKVIPLPYVRGLTALRPTTPDAYLEAMRRPTSHAPGIVAAARADRLSPLGG